MPLPVNKALVRSLVKERFQSVEGLVIEWEERVRSSVQKVGRARDRSAIYRWMDNGLPSNADDVFGFAGVLDVDPVALLDVDRTYVQRPFGRERRLFHVGHADRSLLAPIWPIYVPGQAWPNEEIAHHFYGRPWCVQEFTHDPAVISNVYVAVHLSAGADHEADTPRTYHFAYLHSDAPRQVATIAFDRRIAARRARVVLALPCSCCPIVPP